MKRIYLVLICTLNFAVLQGQCPSGDLIFTTQQQVDDFALNYPGCTEILGEVTIGVNSSSGTTNITNLNGLSQIETIQEDLDIIQNDSLPNLQGLEGLNFIGGTLRIHGNDALINMQGLNNLDTIGGSFQVGYYYYGVNALEDFSGMDNLKYIGYSFVLQHNYNLVNFNGLSSLNTIERDFTVGYEYSDLNSYPKNGIENFIGLDGLMFIGRDFEVDRNPLLEDFSGLENLNTVDRHVKIRNNDNLNTLEGLDNLSYETTSYLIISRNPNLSYCSTPFVCNYIENSDSYGIGNNDFGCDGALEIASSCPTSSCPPVGIIFDTQVKIDSFSFNYPNCTEIGDVIIDGVNTAEITSLNGLSQLTSAENINIVGNNSLNNLMGLNNLNIVKGSLVIGGNNGLTNLEGFTNIDTIEGSLRILNNTNLTNLSGFDNLRNIGLDLSITNNDALTNLAGLESLNTIERQLIISSNYGIINLFGIDDIDYSLINDLQITNNSNLSVCSSSSICGYLRNGGRSRIYNNQPDCNSAFEMLYICTDAPHDDGFIFSTQSQIDSFPILYPDIDSIHGNVIIQGESLTSIIDLSGLSQVSHISGVLIIKNNAALNNLSGLELLTAAKGGLHIDNNDALGSLSALANLIDVQGELMIRNNDILTGLGGIHNIDGPSLNYLSINNNAQLRFCRNDATCNYLHSGGLSNSSVSGNVLGNWDHPACGTVFEIYNNCPQYLPIELTQFQAQIQNKTTLLTWQTATETHNEGFEIQRSKDGTTWEKIGWQDGHGDSQTPYDYTHIDENPLSGTSYYRLKQIDFDGAFSHSDIVKVDYVTTGINIYPNPVKNTLHIADLSGSTIQNITIFDQMGRQVIQQNTNANTIDASVLPSGIYIIQVTLDNGVFSDRFIVK